MPTEPKSIQVFGSGCPTCKTLHQRTVQAAKELSLKTEVEYVMDIQRIIDLGLLQSPVLVVDGEPIVVGFVPDAQEIKEALQNKLSR